MKLSSSLFLMVRIILCFFILMGLQAKMSSKNQIYSIESTEGHSHSISLIDQFDYLFLLSIEHEHHHHEEVEPGPKEHSHEHSHSILKFNGGVEFVLTSHLRLFIPASETRYTSQPLLPYYGSYRFKIFRPPIS